MPSWTRAVGAVAFPALLAACASTSELEAPAAPPVSAPVTSAELTPQPSADGRALYRHAASGLDVELLDFADLQGWADDDHGAALPAFLRSCDRIERLSSGSRVLGGFAGGPDDWREICAAAQNLRPGSLRAFLEIGFTPVRLNPAQPGKATSYFEPILDARRTPVGRFVHPIYAKPPEIVFSGGDYGVREAGALRPFFTRGEIDAGALDGRGLEIAYLADPVDLFFLHIQGSGQLRFRGGETLRVGFAAKNGHAYASAAQEMVRRGWARPGQASADFIRDFYAADPERGRQALAANASYIFFRPLDDLDPAAGPIGAMGVQLQDGRSIAVDRRFAPLGAPVWLNTTGLAFETQRLVIAQDTGTAIKGPQRIDYYWGSGAEAGFSAGRVNQPATVTLLLPNTLVARLTGAGS